MVPALIAIALVVGLAGGYWIARRQRAQAAVDHILDGELARPPLPQPPETQP